MPYSPGEGGELVSASVRSYFLIVLTYFFSSPLGYNKGSEDVAKGSGVRETDRPGLKSQHCRHCWMPGPYYLGLSFLISKVDIKTYLGGEQLLLFLLSLLQIISGEGVQVTCSSRGTQRFPGEGCSRSSQKMRGRWTNRMTQKPGLLGAEELGLGESRLLLLIEEGVGGAGPPSTPC